jgi:hypothetical protein
MIPSSPKQIAEEGERIYRERYQAKFESLYLGKFVALDIKTGEAFIGSTSTEALQEGQKKDPLGSFHLVKVGASGAFRVSFSNHNANLDWIFR